MTTFPDTHSKIETSITHTKQVETMIKQTTVICCFVTDELTPAYDVLKHLDPYLRVFTECEYVLGREQNITYLLARWQICWHIVSLGKII